MSELIYLWKVHVCDKCTSKAIIVEDKLIHRMKSQKSPPGAGKPSAKGQRETISGQAGRHVSTSTTELCSDNKSSCPCARETEKTQKQVVGQMWTVRTSLGTFICKGPTGSGLPAPLGALQEAHVLLCTALQGEDSGCRKHGRAWTTVGSSRDGGAVNVQEEGPPRCPSTECCCFRTGGSEDPEAQSSPQDTRAEKQEGWASVRGRRLQVENGTGSYGKGKKIRSLERDPIYEMS